MYLGQGFQLVSLSQDPNCCHTWKPLYQVLDLQEKILVRYLIQPITHVLLLHIIVLLYISNNFQKKHIRVQILITPHISHQIISLKSNHIVTIFKYPRSISLSSTRCIISSVSRINNIFILIKGYSFREKKSLWISQSDHRCIWYLLYIGI